jgi:membrane protein YqaA with SNARE-associated domain
MDVSATRGGWLRHVSAWAHHPSSAWLLFAVAFADSSFLPIPPDLLLVPMVMMRPQRIWWLLTLCTLGSTLGAAVGYVIGHLLWNAVGAPIVEFYGHMDGYLAFRHLVEEWGAWIIIGKALTPIPFKIAAIAAGAAEMNPVIFMLASFAGRTLHFAMLAILLFFFGARMLEVVARYERPLAVASVLALVAVVVVLALR